MAKHKHRDGNHREIIDALRQCGCSVLDMGDLGDDAPDALVGYRLKDQLMEFKMPGENPTEDQIKWHGRWRGRPVAIIRTVDEAFIVMGIIKPKANETISRG